MEKTASKTKTKTLDKSKIQKAYMEHLLIHGKEPSSIFAFTKEQKIKEEDFYALYNSFDGLEQDVWDTWAKATVETLENDEAYVNYSVREKLLAFYFTWLEGLKSHRSYVLLKFRDLQDKDLKPAFLGKLHGTFSSFIDELLLEGKDTAEVAERPFSGQYKKAFWLHFLFITRFWIKDESSLFEQTDAAVEKSVHFAFDMIGKGPLDSFLELAKFLYQNKKPF
ncbi:MAG: TetR/AcrR family transcriptional regulator [Cyclobacteriaceae bacterium]|nr:TetR/AcrR family transcriptional regulator [Cyclobacteriaceae bacterium HetDA_MAG_MS6]